MGCGVAEHDRGQPLRMTQCQVLANHSAHGQSHPVHALDIQCVEHGDGIVAQLVERVGARRGIGASVTAGIVTQHTVPLHEHRHLLLPHEHHERRSIRARKLTVDMQIVGENPHDLSSHLPLPEDIARGCRRNSSYTSGTLFGSEL